MFIHDQIADSKANVPYWEAMRDALFDAGLDWFWHSPPKGARKDFMFMWGAA